MATKRQSAWMANITVGLCEALAEAARIKAQLIAPGMVRFERNEYHYGQQGQITRTSHLTKDLPEHEAINWIAYGCSTVTWPDGASESFDMCVSPVEHSFHQGYGKLTYANGKEATGTLSRLPNVFVEYYGVRVITVEERATFEMIHDTWNALAS